MPNQTVSVDTAITALYNATRQVQQGADFHQEMSNLHSSLMTHIAQNKKSEESENSDKTETEEDGNKE